MEKNFKESATELIKTQNEIKLLTRQKSEIEQRQIQIEKEIERMKKR